ncbi:MAG: patatin-like phospholipase family protein, partial [Clostridia bacterium]|nr:patatin-like phospholipase family protein [Clostridia bacterium]
MKRALVLSGGGSRGAYECGAWQALKEMNIRIDGVYGTSIGAINAALVAQGDLDTAVQLWNNIRLNQIIDVEEEEDFNIDRMLSGMRDLIPFLIENAKNFRMDISPLVKLVHETIDEGRIRASGMDFGVMLTRFPQLSGVEVRLSDIPQGRLEDYLIASASCFPVFPIKNIDG